MPSSTYMTECQDEGQQEVETPGERRVQINRGKDLEEDFGVFFVPSFTRLYMAIGCTWLYVAVLGRTLHT